MQKFANLCEFAGYGERITGILGNSCLLNANVFESEGATTYTRATITINVCYLGKVLYHKK